VWSKLSHGEHHASPLVSSAVGSPSATHSFFLGVDDQFSALELVAQTRVIALQLLHLSCRGIRLWPPLFGASAVSSATPTCLRQLVIIEE
jgi:hypothetical protein